MNKGTGKPCPPKAEQETEGCGPPMRKCAGFTCAWSDWEEWGKCDAKCGKGKRERKRHLESSATDTDVQKLFEQTAKDNSRLREKTEALESNRMQELFISFAGGAFSLVVLLTLSRVFQLGRRSGARGQAVAEAAE